MRVSEVFGTVSQGEGLHVGAPSVFVRMFGCNLLCRGFGMPRGELSSESDELLARINKNPELYNTLEDLPVPKTGCDSMAASDSRFKRFAINYTVQELADKIRSLLPSVMNGKFGANGKAIHVVFTGGEPLLWQDDIADVIKELVKHGLYDVTFETNGTVELKSYLSNVLKDFGITTTFSVSPKLSASGEPREKAIKPEAIWSYYQHVRETEDLFLSNMYLKFVVMGEDDIAEVEQISLEYYKEIEDALSVYLMPAGGCFEEYTALAPKIDNLAMKYGYKFSPRMHVTLHGNAWGV